MERNESNDRVIINIRSISGGDIVGTVNNLEESKVDVKKLEYLFNQFKNSNDSTLSFLEIINMERSETAVSLMLKYLFENNPECLKRLINTIYKENINELEIENVITEYFIYEDKRIDILIEAKMDNENTVIVIENKIDSSEHGDQCKKYFSYIESRYSTTKHRYYFYLKPASNLSKSNCNEFKPITYDSIYNCITNEEDIYIQEFKKCIERNYMDNKKNELDLYILNNYKEMYKKVIDLDKEIDHFLTHSVKDEVKKELSCEETEFFKSTHYTLRFYDEDCWSKYKSNKDEMFYFYVEVVAHDKEVSKFKFCRIIHAYTKNYNSRINRFVKSLKNVRTADSGNNIWYIMESKDFITDKSILSSEWKKELIEAAKVELKEMYANMRKCVDEFKKSY